MTMRRRGRPLREHHRAECDRPPGPPRSGCRLLV